MPILSLAKLHDSRGSQPLDLSGVKFDGTCPTHGFHERTKNGVDDEDLFFGNAQQVIVITATGNDAARCPVQIGRLVNDDRRITRPGDNSSFSGIERRASDRRSTRHTDDRNITVMENLVGRFQRRLSNDTDQVVDTQVGMNRFIEPPNSFGSDPFSARMRVDHQGVTRCDHADRIAGDRRQGMSDRGDRTDDAKGGMFNNGQSMVTTENLATQELHARRSFAKCSQFFDLVLQAADFRLLHLHRA